MTIFEMILAGLQTKFPGTDTATLTRIATKKAEGVTDETKVNSIVEGISIQDVMQNYGDFRAGQAQTSAVSNYEKKHGLKDGKPIENPEEKKDEKKDDVPSWAQALIDSNKTLSEKLAGYEQERAQAQRNAQVSAKAKEYGIPETLVPMLNIPSDADLDTYMKDAKQTFVNAGLQSVLPDTGDPKPNDDIDSLVASIDKGTKEFVEQAKK
ncbi:hypothetical protein [Paraprevotella xylaniphila]|uniref:hypothetical protein n=1 Tax=Paraprevotella xylaniphila TaxID=454155 RepID=UPI0024A98DA5|nr:hypothetical protein [Paraprevotella xylaniphila]